MSTAYAAPLAWDVVRSRIAAAVAPSRFFVANTLTLEWEHVAAEEVAWEIFHGRLLDATQTRERQRFEAWNVYSRDSDGRSSEPLLSVKLDADRGQLHVVRAIHSYAWEGYHAGDNVYLSRETKKWVRELVGTIDLQALHSTEALDAALAEWLFQAIVGVSRLPLTSIEAPLPAFTLGELGYLPFDTESSQRSPCVLLQELLTGQLTRSTSAKMIELVLRASPTTTLGDLADSFAKRWRSLGWTADQSVAIFRTVFEDVALSPYTDFVDKTLAFFDQLEQRGHWTAEQHVDFLSGLLRQLVRHLTAFDLVTFHHRGANYPDALLLDAALDSYFALAAQHPELFAASATDDERAQRQRRLRRRAVRQACLLRCWYEGHPVPDLPTSPGENSRILPPQFPRVPEGQIIEPEKRQKRLYADDPLLPKLTDCQRDLLVRSLRDLDHADEHQELGMALFLDRPLGIFKRPSEPDTSPLLSYEAFSATIAARRLKFLEERFTALAEKDAWSEWRRRLQTLPVRGLPLQPVPMATRPGVASLADAFRVAPDFVLLRTTRRSVREFLGADAFRALAPSYTWHESPLPLLIVGGAAIGAAPQLLRIYDGALQLVLEVEMGQTRR